MHDFTGNSWSGNFWTSTTSEPPDEIGISAVDDHFQNILRKQEHLRVLFAYEGAPLVINAYNSGSVNLKCHPRVKGINFAEGNWVHKCDYTIELEADVIYSDKFSISGEDPNLYPYVDQASEDWQIEKNEENDTYRLTHNVSAHGKRFYATGGLVREAWENARLYVRDRLGLDQTKIYDHNASGLNFLNLINHSGFNYVRAQTINELGGSFAIQESWVVTSGMAAIETFEVSTRVEAENNLTNVSVQGTIQGLESRDNVSYDLKRTKYKNAEDKYNSIVNNIHGRAEAYSGLTGQLNTASLTNVVGRNPFTGIITYNFEYNNRAVPTTASAISESIEVVDINQNDIFARIPVLGANRGPVLQSIASGNPERLLNIEVVVKPQVFGGSAPSKPDVKSIIISNTPVGYTKLMKEEDSESWNVRSGHYRKTVRWVYRM